MTKHRFEVLDGLRGVAAVMVVAFHIEQRGFRTTLFSHAYLAVDFFFMLSGFVLASAYEKRFAAGEGAASFIFRERIPRLWPVIFVAATVGAVLALVGVVKVQDAPLYYVLALSFLPAIFARTGDLFPLTYVEWSLYLELAVNALHAAFSKRLTSKVLGAVCLLAGIALIASPYGRVGGPRVATWPGGIFRVLYGYPLGVLLYRAHARGWWAKTGWKIPLPALAALLVGSLMIGDLPHMARFGDFVLLAFSGPLLILAGAALDLGSKARWLCSWSGRLSYPIYGVQQVVIACYVAGLAHTTGARYLEAWATAPVAVLLTALVTLLWFDEPVRAAISRAVRPKARSLVPRAA